jgi:hypothetical protein
MNQIVELTGQSADEKVLSGEELTSSDEFSFEIEELDGNRAMMLLAFFDACPTCHHGLQ